MLAWMIDERRDSDGKLAKRVFYRRYVKTTVDICICRYYYIMHKK